jgi:hypothetical protein
LHIGGWLAFFFGRFWVVFPINLEMTRHGLQTLFGTVLLGLRLVLISD